MLGRGYVIHNSHSVSESVTKVGIELLGQLKNKIRETHLVYEPKRGEVKRWEYCLWQVVEDGRSCNVDAAYL